MQFKISLPKFGSGSATVYVQLVDAWSSIAWAIRDVEEIPADRRRKSIKHRVNTDSPAYRQLGHDQRREFECDFFRKLLGEEVYKRVLQDAWMQAMPPELKEPCPLCGSTEEHHVCVFV